MSDHAAIGPVSVEGHSAESQASASRRPKHPVLERLYAEPQRFELFQAVRLLFAEAVEEAAAVNAAAPPIIGGWEGGAVSRAPVRFHSSPTLGFPQGAITAIRREMPSEAAGPGAVGHTHLDLACFDLPHERADARAVHRTT